MTAFETTTGAHLVDGAVGLRVTDGTFTLDEMLRFAATTRRCATVHVDGARAGRVAFEDGCIVAADVAGSAPTNDVMARRAPDGDAQSVAHVALDHVVDVLLEIEVEAAGTGCFELVPGIEMPRVAGVALAVEDVLAAKAVRVREWKEIVAGLPGAGAVLRRAPDLEHPVTLDADDWRVLGALGEGSSVARLTRTAGIGTFATCRSVRRLVDAGAVLVRCEAEPGLDGLEEALDKGTSS